MERKCKNCKESKELTPDNFYRKRTGLKGFKAICKSCQKEKDAARYALKRADILEQKKKYYQKKKAMK